VLKQNSFGIKEFYYWPAYSVGGQTSNGHWRLSSVTLHGAT